LGKFYKINIRGPTSACGWFIANAILCYRLAGNNLAGTIPTELSFLSNLKGLSLCKWPWYNLSSFVFCFRLSHGVLCMIDVAVNDLRNGIPTQISQCRNLEILQLCKSRINHSCSFDLRLRMTLSYTLILAHQSVILLEDPYRAR
jgi:hypothetical protein